MDKADLEDRVKMLEQQLSAQIDTMNLIVRLVANTKIINEKGEK